MTTRRSLIRPVAGTVVARTGNAAMHTANGVESGVSLIGMLLVLAALGGMAAVAVLAIGPGDETGEAPGMPGGGGGVGTIGGAAAATACRADVAALETALAAAQAAGGAYPVTLDELAATGFVSDLPTGHGFAYAPELVGGRPTGRVLVNGRPSEEGCR